MKVFLDLDGVLVDFVGGVHNALGLPYRYDEYPYEKGKWNMLGDVGGKFWDGKFPFSVVNGLCSQEFWSNLAWMHDGWRLLHGRAGIMSKFDDITILTAPMPNPGSWTGKYLWVEKNMPAKFLKNIIMSVVPKSLLAGPDTLLIDDKDENIAEFVAAGGCGILVPRPWNELHGWADEALQVVKNSLEEL